MKARIRPRQEGARSSPLPSQYPEEIYSFSLSLLHSRDSPHRDDRVPRRQCGDDVEYDKYDDKYDDDKYDKDKYDKDDGEGRDRGG